MTKWGATGSPKNWNDLARLKKSDIFRDFQDLQFENLLINSSVQTYKRDELVEPIEKNTKNIYFVLIGGIKRALKISPRREFIFNVTCQNDFDCYYMEWSAGLASNSDLFAISEGTVLLSIPLEAWRFFIDEHSELNRVFQDALYLKYQVTLDRIVSQLLESRSTYRLSAVLKNYPFLESLLTKKELGSYIGVSPETISRILPFYQKPFR